MYRQVDERPRNELIPDHALVDGDGDLFGHKDVVERLLDVLADASTTRSSANVALYGSWGSGKSSVANLLEEALANEDEERKAQAQSGEEEGRAFKPKYRLFRFDAFKYARDPFLRQFIRELADELPDKAKRTLYRERLYKNRSEVQSKLRLPLRWIAGLVVSALLVAVGLDLLIAGDVHGVLDGVAALLVPSAFIVGLIGIAVPLFNVTTSSAAPDSDEQYEEIFCQLLRDELKIDGESETKLVVFVDELDRCAPTEVASLLETLRTFLGVPGCIFIVAADQQVLEQALSEHVRQATPPNPANPYYSAGNAYLDKIFQYQVGLPPFRARRLVNFALQLTEGRGGVWEEVEPSEVIPILLPTHVQSPRRVKVLLNTFALTYGIARSRAKRKELGAIRERAPEIAKLVCLRVEFPLFALDLSLDDRLTGAVVTAATAYERSEDPHQNDELLRLPVEIRRRAVSFARGDLPASRLLAEGSGRTDTEVGETMLDFEPGDAEGQMAELEHSDGEKAKTSAPVRHSQGLQLVRYLEKSIDVHGPYSDLIHLEAAGATFDLDPQLAQQIERDALDRRHRAVLAAIDELERKGRVNALRMLGQLAHESHGLDGRNAMQVLLRAVDRADVPLHRVAPYLAADLEAFDRRNSFDTADLPGAYSIALIAKRSRLTRSLLARDEAVSDETFRTKILTLGTHLSDSLRGRLIEVAAASLGKDGKRSGALIAALPRRHRKKVLVGALDAVESEIRRDLASTPEAEGDPAEGGPAVQEDPQGEAIARVNQLAACVEELANSRQDLAELALIPLLQLPKELTSEAVDSCLAHLAPVRSTGPAKALLDYSCEWSLSRGASILSHVSADAGGAIDAATETLLEHIWTETTEGREPLPGEFLKQLQRLTRFRKRRAQKMRGRGPTARQIASSLQVRVDDPPAAQELNLRLEVIGSLIAACLISVDLSGAAIAEAIASTVRPAISAENQTAIREDLESWLDYAIEHSPQTQLQHARQALQADDCWIPSPQRETMSLSLGAALPKNLVSPPTPSQMLELGEIHGRAAAPAVGIWIERFAPSPEAIARVLSPFASQAVPEIVAALRRYTHPRGASMRARLALPLIGNSVALRLDSRLLTAARVNAAVEEPLVEAICALAAKAENENERKLTFSIWEALEPSEDKSWSALIPGVMLRFARSGPTAFDVARKNLELCGRMPEGQIEGLVDQMRAAVPRDGRKKDRKREKALERSLAQAGLIEGKRKVGIGRFSVSL